MGLDRWTRRAVESTRALWKRPFHAALVVSIFAVGIGVSTAILSLATQLMVAPLPYPAGERLVVPWPGHALPGSLVAGILEDSPNFERLGLYWDQDTAEFYDISDPSGSAVGYRVALVSRSYLDLLGLRPTLGRLFRDEDIPPTELRDGVGSVVLTHEAWVGLFGADSTVLDKPIRHGPYVTRIIGVMPPEATPMARGLDAWSVVGTEADLAALPRAYFQVLGRLEREDAMDAARAELRTRLSQADTLGVGAQGVLSRWSTSASFGPATRPVERQTLVTLRTWLSGNAAGGLLLLALAGVATLLVAVVNASALALNRTLERRGEISIRLALGTNRGDLVGLVLSEQMLLALAGGGAALGIAWLGTHALTTLLPTGLPYEFVEGLGWHAMTWSAAGSLLCGAVSTLVASVPLTTPRIQDLLGGGLPIHGVRLTAARRSLGVLLAAQVGLVTVLMVGAGLLVRTVDKLGSIEPGFSTDAVAVVTVQATGLWQRDPDEERGEVLQRYFRRVADELQALAGVQAVGQGAPPFANPAGSLWEISRSDRAPERGRPDMEAAWRTVASGDYFDALGVPLLRGRPLDETDVPEGFTPSTAVVNELFAEGLWPGEDPVGRTFYLAAGPLEPRLMRVVGVVGTFRNTSLDQAPVPSFYSRSVPSRTGSMPLLVRTGGPVDLLLSRLEETVRSVDPRVPLRSVEPLSSVVARSLGRRTSALSLLGGLAVLGLMLGLLGIYGTTALDTARRSREVGIRMALGANTLAVVGSVLGKGLRPVILGVAGGLLVASGLSPLMGEMLFQVESRDPVTFAVVPGLLLLTASLASLLPAIRASRLDPTETLRCE